MANLISPTPSKIKPCVQNPLLHSKKQKTGVENSLWQRKRCTRQFARNAVRNAKSPSNPTPPGQFTAESAGLRSAHREDDTKHAN